MNYILFGEQYPMIKKRLKRLLQERLGEINDLNYVKYNALEDDLNIAINDCEYLPLGVERKAIIFDNVTFLNKDGDKAILEKFTKIFQNSSDEIDIFLISRESTINEKLDIVKKCKENGIIISCNNLTKEEWPQYIKKYFSDRNIKIDDDAVEELSNRIDGDLSLFLNEGIKLSLYTDHIRVEDVMLMVAKPIEDDVFQLSNALLRKDKAACLDIYRGLKLLGSRTTDTLIPLLANQFRFMFQVLYLDSRYMSASEIANELGVKEGRVKINLRNAKANHLKPESLLKVIDDLYQLDYQIKSGKIDKFFGFELFILNFNN